jgi:hypothetical protein
LAEPRRPTSRHGLSPDSPLLGHGRAPEGYDPQTGVLDLPLSERIRLRIQEELDDLVVARRSVWFG